MMFNDPYKVKFSWRTYFASVFTTLFILAVGAYLAYLHVTTVTLADLSYLLGDIEKSLENIQFLIDSTEDTVGGITVDDIDEAVDSASKVIDDVLE